MSWKVPELAEPGEDSVLALRLPLTSCVLFAREGGIYAVLVCMQEYKTSVLVQQAGLAVSGPGPAVE